jgi:very-short-patch-repair endonuclease
LVLQHCTPFADSGLETLFRTRLRWLRLPIRAQISIHGHRVDYLIGDRLIVQIDGKQHAGAQKAADNSHDAELQARGYHIIRVTYAQVMHDWPRVQHEIQLAIAAGLHLRRMDQRSRRAS